MMLRIRSVQAFLAAMMAITPFLKTQTALAQTLPLSSSPTPGTPIMFWRLHLAPQNSGPDEPMEAVIQNAEEFKRFWGRLYSTHRYENYLRAPKPPHIDFDREVVVVLAFGQTATGGYAIRADNIVYGQGRVEIAVIRSLQGKGCVATTSITSPVDIIRFERPSMPVAFLTREVKKDCD